VRGIKLVLKARSRALAASTVKYFLAIIILTFILPPIVFLLYKNPLLSDLLQLFLIPLIFAYVGRVASIFGYSGSGRFVQIIFAGSLYEALFLEALFITYGSSTSLLSYTAYLDPTFIMLLSFSIAYYGYRILVDGVHLSIGLYASKISKYFFALSIGLYFSVTPVVHYISPIFYAVFLAGLAIDTWVFYYDTAKSEGMKRLAFYLKTNGSRWIGLVATITLFYSILSIPKSAYLNSIIVIAFIILLGLAVFYFIMKLYVLTSRYIDTVTYKVYKKFEYKDDVVINPEMNFLLEAIKQFVLKGDTGRLLIALSSVMTRNEKSYAEIENALRPISNYKARDTQIYGFINIKKMIEAQIAIRNDIVKSVIAQLSITGENEKWKNKANPVQN
jgi:hypothetical protein